MSLGEYAPLAESKRPCVPRPALFALFGALLWAIVGAAAADAAAAKAIRDDVTAGVIGYLQLEVQLDDLYE